MVLVLLTGLLAGTAWLGALALGAALIWRGLRGRRVDDDPHCRRCGYNLIASPQRPGRCPECGATIYGLGTIRVGARKRREPLIIIGAAIMLLCLGPIGFALLPAAGTTTIAPGPAAAAAPQIAPGPASAQGPLFTRQEDLPDRSEPIEAHPHARAQPCDDAPVPVEPEAVAEPDVDEDPPWYRLRTINGCCPHCGCPVGTMSRSPRCPECGRNIAR
jgi:hypothetical protein